MPSNPLGKIALRLGMAAVAALLTGCATPPPDDDPEAKAEFEQINDPLEPANRAIFSANQEVDTYLLRPLALGYRYVVPSFGRDRISDFLDNLKSPIYLANDLLQANFTLAGTTVGRFALNSSFGVFGLMDVAEPMGLPSHQSDFGQTMGVWGIGEGPYIVLPLFGPSNPRDTVGMLAESQADPLDYYLQTGGRHWMYWTRMGLGAVSTREAYLDVLDDMQRTSLDYYSAMRSLYRQRRAAQINGAKDPDKYTPPPAGMSSVPANK
ncbi:VacJ family lipoprotein [Telmatospirillum sp.]|uniref:MlaA family lipoprotein n=1 Tax=Telmatospirillum sp. TaxID=2079197 RepID=UPI00283E372A|nr:VacJ family lipoprotein [Telmatospirillum sp.]MDR3435817.1 VacJ family lipoprotein [Telmatospirillum sp.]